MGLITSKTVNFTHQVMDKNWIGGSCELHDEYLIIQANLLNKATLKLIKEMVDKEVSDKLEESLIIPLNEIENLEHEKAFFTDIIKISCKYGEIKMRCYGAKKFLWDIEQAKSSNSK